MNAISLKTLDQVKAMLPHLYSETSLPVYKSAFGRVERLTGRRLTQIGADQKAWAELSARIVWSAEFKSRTPGGGERAFRDWSSKINGAIGKAHAFVSGPSGAPSTAGQAWDLVVGYAETVEGKPHQDGVVILPMQSSLSFKTLRSRLRDTHPASVSSETAAVAFRATPSGKVASYRRALRLLNKVISEAHRHPALHRLLPAAPIQSPPTLRDEPFDWASCDPAFLASIERAVAIAIRGKKKADRFGGRLGPDPLAERRAARSRRKKPVRSRRSLGRTTWPRSPGSPATRASPATPSTR